MLLRPTFFLFLKVTTSCRISSATHVAEPSTCCARTACLALPRYLLPWEFSLSVWQLRKPRNAVGCDPKIPPLPVMAISQFLKELCCRVWHS